MEDSDVDVVVISKDFRGKDIFAKGGTVLFSDTSEAVSEIGIASLE